MDASEHENDARLYKASAELLSELSAKLPSLVLRPGTSGDIRRWVIRSKVYSTEKLLDRFQEWPQLLDPSLASLVQGLVDAFLRYCITCPQEYIKQHDHTGEICQLPRAVSLILCAFCKVRGHKIIIRLLNNEPKYIEPILSCFHLWNSTAEKDDTVSPMAWEEKYIMLLWLSHLMLAPFELSSISALAVQAGDPHFNIKTHDLPKVAQNLLELGMDHLKVSSKAREGAVALTVRLALRRDMQALDLPGRLIEWAVTQLSEGPGLDTTGYHSIGILSMLFGLTNSASDSEIEPFVNRIFRLAHDITVSSTPVHTKIRDSAPARKLLIKIMRSAAIHKISLSQRNIGQFEDFDLQTILEDCVQSLLEYLSDNDTPVRQAASKALSLVALKLDTSMSVEIGEAVLACLNENMLLENIVTGDLIVATDIPRDDAVSFKKNVNAVNALQWHGAMLTLGHLLFRRALPIFQLPSIIEALLIGLEFEQRSNVGTSVGVGVRDAACFGIWSLARKYSTSELKQVPITTSMLTGDTKSIDSSSANVIQIIATHLMISACLDPSGNLRRGSSAALQELIGRHPDVVIHGIPVVQVVDYHAVARRSRAMIEVATAASNLDPLYHQALTYALLGWRGVKATDADSRRQASVAVRQLASMASLKNLQAFLDTLVTEISQLKPSNRGQNAAARHGYLLALASTIRSLQTRSLEQARDTFRPLLPLLRNLTPLIGDADGRVTVDLENTYEAISAVISAAAALTLALKSGVSSLEDIDHLWSWITLALPVLDRCTTITDKEIVTRSAANANLDLFALLDQESKVSLVSSWLNSDNQKKSDFLCKGRIVTLGLLFERVSGDDNLKYLAPTIVKYLCDIVRGSAPVETKVNAMQSVGQVLRDPKQLAISEMDLIINTIVRGLSDYTIDQRGDVGSLLRLEAIETAYVLLGLGTTSLVTRPVQQVVVKLAAEKHTKIRFQAWSCIKLFWPATGLSPPRCDFQHQADVSSELYFQTLLQLSQVEYLHESVITGLISSSAAGADDISRACMDAIVSNVLDKDSTVRFSLATSMIDHLLQYLLQIVNHDDREVVPALDFLTFVFEQVLALSEGNRSLDQRNADKVWQVSQKLHGQSATISRLEALVRLYSTFLTVVNLQTRALDRLTRMLLHRWPKIRTLAAESIYTIFSPDSIIECDWNAPVAESKPIVLQLRKELGVSGGNAVGKQT